MLPFAEYPESYAFVLMTINDSVMWIRNIYKKHRIDCDCAVIPFSILSSCISASEPRDRRARDFDAMGGNLSKAVAGLQKKSVEIEAAPLEDPPTPPPTDPRLPLSARQLFNISKSWKGIARAMEPTGITMFVRLFEENEDILHLFQKIQYKRIHELHRDSMELAQHAGIVMNTLDESIKKLDNVDYFMDYLHAIGMLHTKIPGFRKDYFWRIESPFLAAVQETLGDRYTENMDIIYKITIRYILETVVKGFDLGIQQSQTNNVQSIKASPENFIDDGNSISSQSQEMIKQ